MLSQNVLLILAGTALGHTLPPNTVVSYTITLRLKLLDEFYL